MVPSHWVVLILLALGIVPSIGSILAGLDAWRRGFRSARYYTLAGFMFLAGLLILGATRMGFLPFNALTANAHTIGSILDVTLLSLALADRINIMKKEVSEAQAGALQIQRRATAELEGEIIRQTKELREKNQQLEQLDRQKTSFFQNVSHELRTPLTLILNPLEEALSESRKDQRLVMAANNARRLLRLVNQLLDFQTLAEGNKELELEPIELYRFLRLLAAQFDPACAKKGIEFRAEGLDSRGAELFVKAELDALEKIVFNFLSNALKFTPEGGRITLTLRITEGKARIAVRDSGPGIAPEDQPRVFEVFQQLEGPSGRETGGSGLGLAIARELAEEMRGQVGVDSRVGQGATFWVWLPVYEPAADEKRAAHGDAPDRLKEVLDDELAVTRATRTPKAPPWTEMRPRCSSWTTWPTCASSSRRRYASKGCG